MSASPLSRPRTAIRQALLLAGLFLGAALALRLLSPTYLGPGVALRLMGVLSGLMVAAYANVIPKALGPWREGAPAALQGQRRFVGWALTLGGVAYALAWLVVPLTLASVVGGAALATALVLAIARVALERR